MARVQPIMKAVVVEAYASDASQLAQTVVLHTDYPLPPSPLTGQVTVRVHATSVNAGEWKLALGYFPFVFKPPLVAGVDLAGVVTHVGSGVSHVKVGDAVWGHANPGVALSCAEYTTLDASHVAIKPAALTFKEAASLPQCASTAYHSLVGCGRLQPGHRVLVMGASGGVGSAAVQLAKALGASFVAATCSARNAEFVRGLGADLVLDYQQPHWDDALEPATFNVVVDAAGGPSGWPVGQRVLRAGGYFAAAATDDLRKTSLAWVVGTMASTLNRKFWSFFPGNPNYVMVVGAGGDTPSRLDRLADFVEKGLLKPTIEKVYTIEQVAEAYAEGSRGHTRGKVVITISEDGDAR